MTWLINIAYLAAAVLYFPVLVYQWTAQKKNRHGWRERFGRIDLPAPEGPRIWLHAVSLGEVNCTPVLVRELKAARPELDVVVSTTTDTGYARACKLYPPERVFRYPLDFSWIVRRALGRIRPNLIVLVELEVWPNLAALARQRGIPVAVINGRLTERSARRLARVGLVTRPMFAGLSWVGAQDQIIAGRFEQVGTPRERIEITGSLKWDTAEVLDSVPGAEALASALGIQPGRLLWVCGSTGPGEEEMILDAYQSLSTTGNGEVTLAIVPRKPERFDEVAELIRRRGFDCLLRSEHPDAVTPPGVGAVSDRDSGPEAQAPSSREDTTTPAPASRIPVLLGDSMGELRKFYSLASVVFVGRSLVRMGGSDPMEVAALAKPIIAGPHMENFQLPLECLRAKGAAEVVHSSDELAKAVRALLGDLSRGVELGRVARQAVLENQGATHRTARGLLRIWAGA